MRTIEHLLTDLGGRGIVLRREDERLLVRAPKGAMTTELSASIRANKTEILAFLTNVGSAQDVIAKAPVDAPLTISFAQQRMWFLDQLEGGTDATSGSHYNIPLPLRLKGNLNRSALEQAFTAIVARHQALRAQFPAEHGEPKLVISRGRQITIPMHDLTAEANPLTTARDLVGQDVTTGFNLAEGPLFRCQLMLLGQDDYVLLVNMHHIISDGWSSGILVSELAQLYPHYCQTNGNTTSPLPALPIQYSDFALWQRKKLDGDIRAEQIDYWLKTLAGIPSLHQIPSDRPRPRLLSYRGNRLDFHLSEKLSQDLGQLARQTGASLFMLLQAGFATLLHRYSGQSDIIIGTPIANRNHRQLEPLIGLFVNTLVVRNDLSGDPSFTTYLDRVKTQALSAYDHQDIPFEQILESLDPERNLSYSPIFQIMFSLVNTPGSRLQLPELTLGPFELGLKTAKFDLTLTMGEKGAAISGSMEYSTDLFDGATIEKMIAHLQQLLAAIVTDPNQRLSRLNCLTEREQAQLLVGWNATDRPFPRDSCIHQLFEDQVARSPHALAIRDVDPTVSYTYAELNAWADQIALVLRARGVGAWTRVGLMVERSAEMIAGIYAILKAGGAYVPIDPSYPAERIAYILADCAAPVLLTKRRWCEQLPQTQARIICLDEPLPDPTPMTQVAPVDGDHLIYIIYTSGSTGQPKGAGVYHRSFVNLLHWFITDFDLGENDRVLLTSSVSFDLSQKNMYAPLLVGGSLHLAPPAPYDPKHIVDLVADRQITWLNCTPSAFYPLIEDSGPNWDRRLSSLRWLFLGGEPISIARLHGWLEKPTCAATIVNTYGPTECTDISNFMAMHEPTAFLNRATPIGKPISNVRLLILDRQLGLLPRGGMGELCIFGASVGPGYLNDSRLAAQKFVPNPFAKIAGDRLYRTGDLTRYLADGNIEFIGRIDHQIKIRGFRIELGEIEAALIQMPAVREAVALIQTQDHQDDKRIVAFVLLEESTDQTPDFDAYLAAKLPDYMIPAFFMVLDPFPFTPSGKIDRNALARLALPENSAMDEFVAPQGQAEQRVAAIFAEILKRESVSTTASFFRMGGHSLLATRIMSRIRDEFGLEIPLQSLFEAPTVRGLAARLGQAATVTEAGIVAVDRDQPLPLSFSQERLWFLYQLEGAVPTYNMPLAVRVHGRFDIATLARAYSQVITRHENLRTTFISEGDQTRLLISAPTPQTMPLIDLTQLPTGIRMDVAAQIRTDHGLAVFHLETGPLHRLSCLRTGTNDHTLLLNMHHIISDGWSESLLMREMILLYQAYRLGQPSPLAALTIQYADYAIWQRQQFQGEKLETQLAYWREQLGDGPKPLALPTDFVRPAVRTFSGAHCSGHLPAKPAQQLRALAADEDATLFMALLAGFYHLLARHSGSDDITVGTPIAGRNRGETEPLIGIFLNTLVLRADLSGGDLGFRELLARVRKLTLDAYANQDVPFEKLLAALNPERDLSRTPLFQVFFNMLNLPEVDSNPMGDLRFEQLGNPEIGSKFDLTLYVGERPDASITFHLHYNGDLFEPKHMQALLDQYRLLLSAIAVEPDQPLPLVSLISEQARQLLPNPTAPLSQKWEGPVFQHLARWATSQPTKIAVQSNDVNLDYATLEQRTNALAHWLGQYQIGPGDRVVIYAARCPSLVVAIIASLKAGATITLLDPAYPVARLTSYLTVISPKILLTLETAGPPPRELRAPHVLSLNAQGDAPALMNMARSAPGIGIDPDDPACITFTSGSTGKPKAIIGRHGSLTHFMPWLSDAFSFSQADRFSMLSGLAHDPLQRDIFTPLWLGATLCVPHGDVIGPGLLFDWMAEQRISVAHLTPAMVRILAERHETQVLSQFRLAFITGDVLTSRDVTRLRSITSQIEVVNFYGTTETQRAVAFSRTHQSTQAWLREAMPLGRGMTDVQLLVINGAGGLAGIGEIGEIHLRSPHIALGYLDQPQLTRQCFIANPFDASELHTVYRTGDLGFYLPDGRVAFAGRVDHQVKIRGYRIELPEIEGVLAAHTRIDEAVVIIHQAPNTDPFLVAYLQSADHLGSDLVAEVRTYLKAKLPGFMVPTTYVPLARLPLNPNGKIDRNALRKIPLPQSENALDGQAPATPTEEILCTIWQEVLALEQVPIDGNFFDLGGHSLSATRVITRIRDTFGFMLPLRSIFEAPTVRALAKYLETQRRQHRHEPPLLAQTHHDSAPLSFAQERLWFLDRLEGASPAYNMPFALRLDGELNLVALKGALSAICERHQILRARFRDQDGQAQIYFRESTPFQLTVRDVAEDDVLAYAASEARRPFDLEEHDLLRAVLLRQSDTRHSLLITIHHIICDGWSLGILSEEMATIYQQLSQNQTLRLPALPIQYSDFSRWQRSWLKGSLLQEQLDYWRAQLRGAPSRLELATDRTRPLQQTFHGARKSFTLDAALTHDLSSLATGEGATLFMLLEAAFALLLARYSGSQDVLIGTPVANRTRAETEKLIGMFVNTLVLRNDTSGNPTFSQLLTRVRKTALDAYAHQDVPFEKIIDTVKPERNLGFSPLFQVMLVFQNLPLGKRVANQLAISHLESAHITAKFDLSLTLSQAKDVILGNFEYNTDLFDPATIDRKIEHFQNLLRAITAQPNQPISQLGFLNPEEIRAQRLATTEIPFGKCVHQMIEDQVGKTPAATALIGLDGTPWTYDQLNQRANGLAHHLIARGVKPQSFIAVMMARCPEMILAMLAIHKCGAAYLPLDPSYPQERLRFMREDASPLALITLEPCDQTRLYQVNLATFNPQRPDNPDLDLDPNQLSHLIYTSGSTGKPKGVAIRHGATAALIGWAQRTFEAQQWAGVLASTSICFDLSVFEIFAPLTCGGTVILAENALAIATHPARDRVRLINTVPSAIAELIHNQAIPASVHTINLAGEPLHGDLVRQLYDLPHIQRIYNLYGPSEDTTYSTAALIPRSARSQPPIGKPLDGTATLVLGPHLEVLPACAVGMLYLSGAGLAQGYLDRPALTAAAFLPHPFADGKRIYRTGDRVRHHRDGELAFLGRLDHQVKLRGFRIELGEIEAALIQAPQVEAGAVQVIANQLVAFIQTCETQVETALKAALVERLPAYMIPVRWLCMAQLPLTANGKIDRAALIKLAQEGKARPNRELALPQSENERKLHQIWAEVLPDRTFGIDDNFFEIGGDSILSLRIIARARKLGIHLNNKQIFRFPTIRQLADAANAIEIIAIDAEQGLIQGQVALTPIQAWFLDMAWAKPGHFNQSLLFSLSSEVDLIKLEQALIALVNHHDALRLRFSQHEGAWHQSHASENPLQFQIHDLSQADQPQKELEQRASAIQASADLTQGPLIRAAVFTGCAPQDPDRSTRLLIVIHHLIVDGISWRILMEDLAQAYLQPTAALPAKTTSFKAWSQRLATLAIPAQERDWWRAQVQRGGQGIATDRSLEAKGNSHAQAATIHRDLNQDHTRALLGEAHRAYHTGMDDLLLTALLEAVSTTFATDSLLVDLEGHGRHDRFEDVDLSRTVGWFTTLYPIRLEMVPNPHPAALLKHVKETRRAIPNQGLGYGLLRHLHRDLELSAPADLVFNYLGQTGERGAGHQLFGPAGEAVGPRRSPSDQRTHLLELNAIVSGGKLRVSWTYATTCFAEATIERLATSYNERLATLVDHCMSAEAGGYTPSDFPLARLNQAALDRLIPNQAEVSDLYPLAPMQEGMLFHALAQPASGNYFEQLVLDLSGDLDLPSFEKAWADVIDHHPVLRTSFHWTALERPLQWVHPTANLPMQRIDLRQMTDDQVSTQLAQLLAEERRKGFKLAAAPLMRLILVHLGESRWQIIWNYHHILLDGWSSALLFRQVMAAYAYARHGEATHLPSTRPFRDYICWLEAQNPAEAAQYWRETLAGFAQATPLPCTNPILNSDKRQLQAVEQRLSSPQQQELADLAASQGITLNTLVQAAWAMILAAYSGADDVLFGAILSGRPASLDGVETMVGLFINALPVRIQLANQPLAVWLQTLQTDQLTREKFSFTPLAEAQSHSQVPSGQPLFESLLVFENYAAPGTLEQGPDLGLQIARAKQLEQTHFPLVLIAVPGETLRLKLGFETQRFATSKMTQLLANLVALLVAMPSAKEQTPETLLRQVVGEPTGLNASDSNLSENQLLIWMGQELEPEDLSYHNMVTFTLKGAINSEHFFQAFEAVVAGSDALRTRFYNHHGTPMSRVQASMPRQRVTVDFSDAVSPHTAWQAWLATHKSQRLNLNEYAFETVLAKLATDEYVWFWKVHQLVADGEAIGAIYAATDAVYQQIRTNDRGQSLSLPQFATFLVGERNYRASKQYQRDRTFWQTKLADQAENLSFYGLHPARKTAAIVTIDQHLDATQLARLDGWLTHISGSQASHQARLNFFLATLAIYLGKVSGHQTVTIGIPLHNRRSKAFKQTIGSFMHVLPLRVTIEGHDTIQSLMSKIARLSFESLRYGRAALANSKQNPVYDVILNYHISHFADFADCPMVLDWVHPGSGHLAMTLQISDFQIQNQLKLSFELHTGCFPENIRTRVPPHFLKVLVSCLDNPTLPLSQIQLQSADEERALIQFNPPIKPLPASKSVVSCIETAVHRVPARLAVVAGNDQLTFAELDQKANHLAHHLLAMGAGCESRIGICLDKDIHLVVAVLAVLKTGAAYVPLDPGYPQERLAYMIADSAIGLILTQSAIRAQLANNTTTYLLLDEPSQAIAPQPLPAIHPGQAAYVIYTSGSTGRPKGVVISHLAWYNAFRAWETSYALAMGATVHLQMAGFSFDVFCGDLARALCSGGTLVLVEKTQLLDAAQLYTMMVANRVTHAEFVPAVLRNLADELERTHQDLSFLQLLAAGSDSWFSDEYGRFRKLLADDARLINSYGVSEATIDSCYFETQTTNLATERALPIGQPFANSQLFVLDAQLYPTAIGVPGELYIAGPSLARAYLNQPRLTADRFIPSPFDEGQRLYRSGDLVRHQPESLDLEFLGRVDQQIKIRGFRVEPGEVEAALGAFDQVQSVVVLMRERPQTHEKTLVAHILPRTHTQAHADLIASLRSFAKAALPDHMLPATFDILSQMPLSANGKIDRRALGQRVLTDLGTTTNLDPARDPLEEHMVQLWQSVLAKQPIGIHANFFDLGGHSLSAVRLIAQCRQHLDRPLQLNQLFAHPTVAQLCDQLRTAPANHGASQLVPLQANGHKRPFFCIHAAGGGVMAYRSLAQYCASDRPFYAMQANQDQPIADIETMAATYLKAIRQVQAKGPYLLGGWSMGGTIAFEMTRQLQAAGETVARLILIDSMPFDQMNLGDDFGEPDILASYVNQLAKGTDGFAISADQLRAIPAEKRLDHVMALGTQAGLLPQGAELEELMGRWQLFKTNALASYHYQPQPIKGSIQLLRAKERDSRLVDLADHGWGELADQINSLELPGNHMTMVTEPHVRRLAQEMDVLLEGFT